jgi:hypothetical protein
MYAVRVLMAVAICGGAVALAAPTPKEDKPDAAIDGLVQGKPVRPDAKVVRPGAGAAVKLLAASNLTDFLNPGQPVDKDVWMQEVAAGIDNKRSYLRVKFDKPRPVEGRLNGEKAKVSVSEVVFFEPGNDGPVCLWARDGDRYYFANQIAGHEELVKWIVNTQGR